MASTDLVTRVGVSGSTTYAKAGKSFLITRVGWGGELVPARGSTTTNTARTRDWLLRADEIWIDPKTGRPSRRFFQLMREICETRLGGVNGRTVPQVIEDVATTQTEVAVTVNYATRLGEYTETIAATANATAEVLQTNGEPGAEDIPESPPTGPVWNRYEEGV